MKPKRETAKAPAAPSKFLYEIRTHEGSGRTVPAEKAQQMGELLREIAERRGVDIAELTPREVVDAAEKPKSPLHEWFEWDDSRAGERYRLLQASQLLRQIRVTFVDAPEIKSTRMFVNVKSARTEDPDAPARVYVPIDRALADAGLRQQVLAQAWQEASAWMRRYRHLTELAEAFGAIESVGRQLGFFKPDEQPAAAAGV